MKSYTKETVKKMNSLKILKCQFLLLEGLNQSECLTRVTALKINLG